MQKNIEKNIFKRIQYNLKRKNYDDMYNKPILEEPERLEFESPDDFIMVVSIVNCFICSHFKAKKCGFDCTKEDCNSYDLVWQHDDTYFTQTKELEEYCFDLINSK